MRYTKTETESSVLLHFKDFDSGSRFSAFRDDNIARYAHSNCVRVLDAIFLSKQVLDKTALRCKHTNAVIVTVNDDDVSVLVGGDTSRVFQLSVGAAFGPDLTNQFAATVKHFNAVVIRVGDDNFVVDAGSDVERIVELVVTCSARAETFDAFLFTLVDTYRVLADVGDDAVSVRTDRQTAWCVELA